jgi:hypothetical protein
MTKRQKNSIGISNTSIFSSLIYISICFTLLWDCLSLKYCKVLNKEILHFLQTTIKTLSASNWDAAVEKNGVAVGNNKI